MSQDQNTECVLQRHRDGKLSIQSAPEIFLCTRGSIQDLIDRHNEAVAEMTRLEAELATASRAQQTVTIAEQTIQSQAATIERLTHQRDEAQNYANNANLRAERAKRERDAIATDLDQLCADVRALFTETEHEKELHAIDQGIAFERRKLAFLDQWREIIKPSTTHEDDAGATAATRDGPTALRCIECDRIMIFDRTAWACHCGARIAKPHTEP